MEKYVLRTNNLSKSFKSFQALRDVSLALEPGRIYGLIGRNGAGKTTLMRIIAGLSFSTAGELELFGRSKPNEYKSQLKRIGTLIEYPGMNGALSAKENLKIHRFMRGIPNDEFDMELLEMVGLGDTGKKQVKDFSLGMKQRLGIAIALLSNPELLVLDEPVNGLDPVGVVEIRNLIKNICEEKGVTVLISSHNLPELYQTATDYILIDKGEIKETLTMEQLDEHCRHHIHINCDTPEKLVEVLEQKVGTNSYKVLPDKSVRLYDYVDEAKRIAQTLIDNGIVATTFHTTGETLENYFLSVIGGAEND